MKNEDIKYNKFISKYNQFQEEIQKTNQFLIQIQSFFNQQIKQIDSLTKKLNEQNKYLINEEKINNKDYIYVIIKLINETFESMMNLDKRIIMELLTNLTKLIDNIKKDNKKYDSELETIYNQIQEEKEKMGMQKKLFYDSTLEVEKNVLDKLDSLYKKKDYSNEFLNSLELSKEPKINYINYKNSIEKLNEKIKELNNKEKFFLEQKENIYNTLNEFTTNILNLFYENQYIKNNLLSKNRTIIKEMIISNNNSILKNKSKSNILNKYCLDLIEFETFPSSIDFLNIENNKEFQISIYTIQLLKEKIGDIYPNFSIEKESKRNDLREKIKKLIYDTNNVILEEDKNELFDILMDNEDNQRLFLNLLNRLRINGKYKRNKEIIYLIGNYLNHILNSLSINKNYDMAKTCIILSQTFFYENDKKEKLYSFEFIKDNKWIKKEEFWRNYIDLIIIKEFMKFQKNLKDININIFMNNNISNKMAKKIEELLFAQLVPCINTMLEFKIDKKIIISLVEEFTHKYNYLKQTNLNTIYNLISNNKIEIKKIKDKNKKKQSSDNINDNDNKNIKKESINQIKDNKKITNEKKVEEDKINISKEKDKQEIINTESNEKKEEELNKKTESNKINTIIISNEKDIEDNINLELKENNEKKNTLIESNKINIANEKDKQDNINNESNEKKEEEQSKKVELNEIIISNEKEKGLDNIFTESIGKKEQ